MQQRSFKWERKGWGLRGNRGHLFILLLTTVSDGNSGDDLGPTKVP